MCKIKKEITQIPFAFNFHFTSLNGKSCLPQNNNDVLHDYLKVRFLCLIPLQKKLNHPQKKSHKKEENIYDGIKFRPTFVNHGSVLDKILKSSLKTAHRFFVHSPVLILIYEIEVTLKSGSYMVLFCLDLFI